MSVRVGGCLACASAARYIHVLRNAHVEVFEMYFYVYVRMCGVNVS